MEFLTGLEPLLKAFWFVTIPVTIVFAIQTVMTFIGADASDGTSADFDGDLSGADTPFQLFSFRNLINFLLGFGWAGVSLYGSIPNQTVLIFVSLAVGALFVYMFFFIIKQLLKLADDASFKISNTLHKTAEVYLTIPASKSGAGKILVSVNGSVHELAAMTEGKAIPSGSIIKIIRIENNNILIVEKI